MRVGSAPVTLAVAGIALALIIVLALFGAFGAVGALITPGDAAKTAPLDRSSGRDVEGADAA
jgi:hypothetical protein